MIRFNSLISIVIAAQLAFPITGVAAPNVQEATDVAVDYLNQAKQKVENQADANIIRLMAEFVYWTLLIMDLKGVHNSMEALNRIEDPNARLATQGATYAVVLGLTGYGTYKLVMPSKKDPKKVTQVSSRVSDVASKALRAEPFTLTKVGKGVWAGTKVVVRGATKTVVLGGVIIAVLKSHAVAFLTKEDYDQLLMLAESEIQNISSQLSVKGRESLLPTAKAPASAAPQTFKLEN